MPEKLFAEGYPTCAKIKLRTGGSAGGILREKAAKIADGLIEWSLEKRSKKWNRGRWVRLPVKHRCMSPITFNFYDTSRGPTSRGPDAYVILWLDTVVDNESTPILPSKYRMHGDSNKTVSPGLMMIRILIWNK